MKTMLLIIVLSLSSFFNFAQTDDTKIWGEFALESTLGGSFNVKHNKMVYSLGYMDFVDFSIFADRRPEFQINRIDFDVHRLTPLHNEKLDFTYGLGLGYGFGERHVFTGYAGESQTYDVQDYNSIIGNAGVKLNYYITPFAGLGIGGRAVVGQDYSDIFPQIRLMVGNLRD